MSFGVTDQGFVPETLTDLKAALEAAIQAGLGANVDVSAESPYGQLIGILAERYASCWDAMSALYALFNPDGATGAALDNVCGMTGTIRTPPIFSKVPGVLIGTNGSTVTAGAVAIVGATGARFALAANVTIATVAAWGATTAYVVGQLAAHDTGKIYYCGVAGTSAGSGGPTGTGAGIVDGGVTWYYVATAAAAVTGSFVAASAGPVVAAAGTLTTIGTPTAGWSSITNPLDATLGAFEESDPDLRLKREQELSSGKSQLDAVRAQVLKLSSAGVTGCTIFNNPTDSTDGNGVPPHSFETLVIGSGFTDQQIFDVLWQNMPMGIQAYGSITGTSLDTEGNLQTVKYSKPTETDIYVVANVTADSTLWSSVNAATLTTLVKNALIAYGAAAYALTGKDVVAAALEGQLLFNPVTLGGVAGVLDSACDIGTAPSPGTRTTVAIDQRHFAKLDTSRITVNISYGLP